MENKIMRNSLKKNFSWNFIGNLIYAATQWALIIVITRLGSVEMVGLFSLGLALCGPIILFTNLQLRTIQATSYDGNYNIRDYFGIRVITDLIFCFIIVILLFISNYDSYTNLIIILVALTKIIESLSDLLYGFFQQKERMELISKSTILRGVLSLVIAVLVLFFTNSLIITLLGISFSWLIVFLFYDVKNLYEFSSSLKPEFTRKNLNIIKLALPLGIVVMIVSLNTNLPKILIENMLDAKALGYFASISYLVFIGSKFIDSIGNALLPRLAILYNQKNVPKFKKYLLNLVSISFVIGIILIILSMLIGDYLLYIIYGPEFFDYRELLILIMIYGMFNYVSYSLMVALNAMRKFKIQPYLGVLWLLVSIISLIYFIPKYGLIGAALALILYAISRVISIGTIVLISLRRVSKGNNNFPIS